MSEEELVLVTLYPPHSVLLASLAALIPGEEGVVHEVILCGFRTAGSDSCPSPATLGALMISLSNDVLYAVAGDTLKPFAFCRLIRRIGLDPLSNMEKRSFSMGKSYPSLSP